VCAGEASIDDEFLFAKRERGKHGNSGSNSARPAA
jgi:hypothetical protein